MSTSNETSANERALAALFQQMIDGWNQGDGQAYAAPFTEDADYVIVDGQHVRGREVIASGHQYILRTVFKGSQMQGRVKDIRFLSPDVALLHAEGVLQMPGLAGIAAAQPSSMMTIVAIRQSDKWSFTALQNTRLEERPER